LVVRGSLTGIVMVMAGASPPQHQPAAPLDGCVQRTVTLAVFEQPDVAPVVPLAARRRCPGCGHPVAVAPAPACTGRTRPRAG